MIQIDLEEGDAAPFIARVQALSAGIVRMRAPRSLVITRIDNWFGPKWLAFSGKLLGALGIAKKDLTLPPFVPSRVIWQRYYQRDDDGSYYRSDAGRPLHIEQTSRTNLQRWLRDLAPDSALLWFSGRSAENGRGAIMAYLPSAEGHWCWYSGFAAARTWNVTTIKGVSRRELAQLQQETVDRLPGRDGGGLSSP